MAFGKKIELSIGAGGSGLLISDLNIVFNIEKSTNSVNNTAKFTIYGAKENTISQILRGENNVIFKAGYQDENNLATIFIGTITKSISKKDGQTVSTEIDCIDFGSNSTKFETFDIGMSYKSSTPLTSVINEVASIFGMVVNGISNISDIVLNNGFVFVGSGSNVLKMITKSLDTYGIGLYFDGSEMVLYKKDGRTSQFGIVTINKNSGLIGSVEDITDENNSDDIKNNTPIKKRVKFSSLLNSKLKPNSLIDLNYNGKKGLFFIDKITFSGDNMSGEFKCDIEAVE